jgi:hypothetical protein
VEILPELSVAWLSALLTGTSASRVATSLADRLRVDRVVVAAFHIGLGVSGRHQEHVVTHRREFARPIMRRAAGLHADKAGFDPREKLEHLRALQLALHDGADGEGRFIGQMVAARGADESAEWRQPAGLIALCENAATGLPALFAVGRDRGPWLALARKLLVALWKYVTAGVVKEGVVMKTA